MRIQSRFLAILTVLALVAVAVAIPTTISQTAASDDSHTAVTRPEAAPYIIQLAEAPLASYRGGVAGLAATNLAATGHAKLENNAATAAYLSHLEAVQADFVRGAEATLGRSLAVKFTYQHAFNGLSAVITPAEAAQIAQMAGVKMVSAVTTQELLTDVGPAWIGAPGIWDGSQTPNNAASRGAGVVVAILDTGSNSGHPSFAATDMDGYTHTNPLGTGNYLGVCDPSNPDYQADFVCNAKLIGVHDFIDGDGNDPNSPEDGSGHGSHTASTVAGNRVLATLTASGNPFTNTISGVAPRANIIAYDVCRNGSAAAGGGCPGDALLAAVNQVVADHMVVPGGIAAINYSISGGETPYTDPVELAFLAATDAGIFVSAAAGNSGPSAGTVFHVSPWVSTVAASTYNRQFGFTLDVISPTIPIELQGMLYVRGAETQFGSSMTAEIRYDATNQTGCTPFPANYFQNSFALIQRGGCDFATQINHAATAEALGVVVFNHVAGAPFAMAGLTGTPPAVMISRHHGQALQTYINDYPGAEIRLNTDFGQALDDEWGDIMAGFSSRGPVQAFSVLKPDVTAPGVAIWAAVADSGDGIPDYARYQGTSMSSPHNAGAAVLLKALYPTWSPHQIKSALMLSADNVANLKQDGLTPADPFDLGAGRIQVDAASRVGFVLDETTANFEAADPTLHQGQEEALEQLNLASFANGACVNECSWTRTLQSVAASDVTYSVTVSAPAGITITVSPALFTLTAGETQIITVEADVRGAPLGAWQFASLHFTEQVPAGYTDLVGYFDVSNWTVTNDPSDTGGVVNSVAGPPVELYVTSGDNGNEGTTSATITIPVNGIVSFDWGFESADDECFDMGGIVLNDVPTLLACNESSVPFFAESYSLTVSTGDVFGFYADTNDGEFGAGVLGITNFQLAMPSITVDKAMPIAVRPATISVPVYGVELHVATSGITDTTGTAVTYTVHITNTGITTDTFDIGATGMWTTTASVGEMELGEGEMGMFTVTVEIPADAEGGEDDIATITATSQGNNTAADSVMLTTTAEGSVAPPTYGVELHVAPSGITATAGTAVTYTVHITNTGNTIDTFDIGTTGVWTTTASVGEMELGEGEMGMFMVTVEIPADAEDGESNMATIAATSQGDNTANGSVMVMTTAGVPPRPTYTIFLPLISR
jgi:hypothetical protein